jgi:membrane-bound ClpP family serine protease
VEAEMTILGVFLVILGAVIRQPDLWSVGIVLGMVGVIVAVTSRALRISTTEMRRHYY